MWPGNRVVQRLAAELGLSSTRRHDVRNALADRIDQVIRGPDRPGLDTAAFWRVARNVLGVASRHLAGGSSPAGVHRSLADTLLDGSCDCYVDWARFDVSDKAAAQELCREHHALDAWEEGLALDDFLYQAIVWGPLARDHLDGYARALGLPPAAGPEQILLNTRALLQHSTLRVLPDLGLVVFGLEAQDAFPWVSGFPGTPKEPGELGEAYVLAGHISQTLYKGTCDCWQRWDDFGIESESAAVRRCRLQHTLASWDRTEAVGHWLERAAIGGTFSQANGLRKAMLAPAVFDPRGRSLQINRAMVCQKRGGCSQEVTRSNGCGCDPPVASVQKPSWWTFVKESRHQCPVWRCDKCGFLYFRKGQDTPCPRCHASSWKPAVTWVWVPLTWGTLEPFEIEWLRKEPDETEEDDGGEDAD